jgi:hypothetical protein
MYVYVFPQVSLCGIASSLRLELSQIRVVKELKVVVALPGPVGGGDVTNWYQS